MSQTEGVSAKPTVAELGIDVGAQNWQRSSDGDGAIEVAFVGGAVGTEWVLVRVAGDPGGPGARVRPQRVGVLPPTKGSAAASSMTPG